MSTEQNLAFMHDVVFANSDEGVLDVVVPFVAAGCDAGEPTIAALDAPHSRALRAALGDAQGLHIIGPLSPVSALDETREHVLERLAAGARRVRIAHVVPADGDDVAWEERCRSEAVANAFFADLPMWGRCIYDTTGQRPDRLSELERIHPFSVRAGEPATANRGYQRPEQYLAERLERYRHHLAGTPAATELVDPSPAVARAMLRPLLVEGNLDPTCAADMLVATSEIVTNAIVHGEPPVTVRGWNSPDGVVISVSDTGSGPADPLAGFFRPPASRGPGGLGIWLARRLVSLVDWQDEEGYTVQLTARAPEQRSGVAREGRA